MARLRGRKLQRLRHVVFAAEPLCRACSAQGRVSVATEMDHIKPISAGGDDSLGNLQPLCTGCHAEKTARDMGHARPAAIGADGWPEGAV